MINHNNPSIEISRESNKIHSVKMVMPVWKRNGNDDLTYVEMPLLGLMTYGKGDEDVDLAIEETIKAFCIASEKFGLGLESELQYIGWKMLNETSNSTLFVLEVKDSLMEEVMHTGFEKAFDLNITEKDEQLACV